MTAMTISLIDQIKKLDFNIQLIVAYLTCERLYPNYVYFSNKFEFGDSSKLRSAIDYIYEHLFENDFDIAKIKTIIGFVEKNTPEPGEFQTILASSALDAGVSIIETLESMIVKDRDRLSDVSKSAVETVYMYIQEIENLDYKNDDEFDIKMDNHPLMKNELQIQQGIITYLINSRKINYDDVNTLLQLQDKNGKGNLEL